MQDNKSKKVYDDNSTIGLLANNIGEEEITFQQDSENPFEVNTSVIRHEDLFDTKDNSLNVSYIDPEGNEEVNTILVQELIPSIERERVNIIL
jgi:hypothetical protein